MRIDFSDVLYPCLWLMLVPSMIDTLMTVFDAGALVLACIHNSFLFMRPCV